MSSNWSDIWSKAGHLPSRDLLHTGEEKEFNLKGLEFLVYESQYEKAQASGGNEQVESKQTDDLTGDELPTSKSQFIGGYDVVSKINMMLESISMLESKHALRGMMNLCLLVTELEADNRVIAAHIVERAIKLGAAYAVEKLRYQAAPIDISDKVVKRVAGEISPENFSRYLLGFFSTCLLVTKMDVTKFKGYMGEKLKTLAISQGLPLLPELFVEVDLDRLRSIVRYGSGICRFGFGMVVTMLKTSEFAMLVQTLCGLRLAGAGMIMPLLFMQVSGLVGIEPADLIQELRIKNLSTSVRAMFNFLMALAEAHKSGYKMEMLLSKLLNPFYFLHLGVKDNGNFVHLLMQIGSRFGATSMTSLEGVNVTDTFSAFALDFAIALEEKYAGCTEIDVDESELVQRVKAQFRNRPPADYRYSAQRLGVNYLVEGATRTQKFFSRNTEDDQDPNEEI
nr:MAG: nucleoprotein [Chemarfal virus 1]